MIKFSAVVFLVLSAYASADTLTYSAKTWPCDGGKTLGMIVMKKIGTLSVVARCDPKKLVGYKDHPSDFAETEKNQQKYKSCSGDATIPWVKACFEKFEKQCPDVNKCFNRRTTEAEAGDATT